MRHTDQFGIINMLKDWEKLTDHERNLFQERHGSSSLKHTRLFYDWYKSIIDRHYEEMCNDDEGEQEILTEAYCINYEVDVESGTTVVDETYDHPVEVYGHILVEGYLNILNENNTETNFHFDLTYDV